MPEQREEVTTEGGLNLEEASDRLLAAVAQMRAQAVRTALFVDAREDAMRASAALGADAVELHTGEYANARTPEGAAAQLGRLRDAAMAAREAGLAVHAGHGPHLRERGAGRGDPGSRGAEHRPLDRKPFGLRRHRARRARDERDRDRGAERLRNV